MKQYFSSSNLSKRLFNATSLFILLALIGYLVLVAFAHRIDMSLGNSKVLTGYSLLSVILFLAAFNIRKRFSVIPLFKVKHWTRLHIILGVFVFFLFFVHTGVFMPSGLYEILLAIFFYLSILTGLLGYFLTATIPERLTATNIEVIYERIADEISDINHKVESIIIDCAKENNTNTLTRHFVESLNWFYVRPRFFMNHIFGGQRGAQWIEYQFSSIQHYLNASEKEHLQQIYDLAILKNKIDYHYSLQTCLKAWLFIHVPASMLMILLAFWHLLIVNIYAL